MKKIEKEALYFMMLARERRLSIYEEAEIIAISFFISLSEYEDIVKDFQDFSINTMESLLEKTRNLPENSMARIYCEKLLSIPAYIRKRAIISAYHQFMEFLDSINKIKYYLCSTKEQLREISENRVMRSGLVNAIKKEYKRQISNSLDEIRCEINKSL